MCCGNQNLEHEIEEQNTPLTTAKGIVLGAAAAELK